MIYTTDAPRIRLINRRHEMGGKWLSDKMIGHALREFADYQSEEPDAGWKLEVCGDLMDWHEFGSLA